VALFPKCTFEVLLPPLVAGTRVPGTLVVHVPEPIPRAERIHLVFRSKAWAGYGSGKSRTVERRQLLFQPFHVDLPEGVPLPAGDHRYPFELDVPAWVPPGIAGDDCAVEHDIEIRVEVDWAKDPRSTFRPVIVLAPTGGERRALSMRSSGSFHDRVVLEVSMPSSVIVHGDTLEGRVALRSGHDARFSSLQITLVSSQLITMARGDLRNTPLRQITVPADTLRRGEPVVFRFGPECMPLPSFDSAYIDHDYVLELKLNVPLGFDPSFLVPLKVLPRGSTLYGDTGPATAVGGERVRLIAETMARETGLPTAQIPVLVEGPVAATRVRLTDAPREGRLGVEMVITFPEVGLGASFRPLGMLEGFRQSPLLPRALADRYLLRTEPVAGEAAISTEEQHAFLRVVLDDLGTADEVRFSDHHLAAHFPIPADDAKVMTAIGRAAIERAKVVSDAIGRLPFPPPVAASAPAWEATAREEHAFLVPSIPAIHGVTFRARVLAGEERSMRTTIRTVWRAGLPTTEIDVDLRSTPLPPEASAALVSPAAANGPPPSELLRVVHAAFPTAHTLGDGKGVSLAAGAFASDPRALFAGLEALLGWVLEVRGERRVDAPYR